MLEALQITATDLGLVIKETNDAKLKQALIDHINELATHHFSSLVALLYRLDIDENKLRATLETNNGSDAAVIITELIIERQAQKIQSRRDTKQQGNIPEDEKW